MSPEPKKMKLTYFERNAGVRIGVLKDGETPLRVRIAIPFELEGRAGEFDLDFSTITGIDAFVRDLQTAREMVHGPYGHIPAHCTHCGSEISRQDPAGVREHVMTCEKNPLVVLLGEKARRLVELQKKYEELLQRLRVAEGAHAT